MATKQEATIRTRKVTVNRLLKRKQMVRTFSPEEISAVEIRRHASNLHPGRIINDDYVLAC